MPPKPTRPMNSPCPIHSGQGGPKVEIDSPSATISAPNITVQRVPTRSAIWPMMMPPMPEPSQASALANEGMARAPPTSAAMSFSATAVIHAAPNDISIANSATLATTQDALVSIESEGECNIRKGTRLARLFTGHGRFDQPRGRGRAMPIAMRQNARLGGPEKFHVGLRGLREKNAC